MVSHTTTYKHGVETTARIKAYDYGKYYISYFPTSYPLLIYSFEDSSGTGQIIINKQAVDERYKQNHSVGELIQIKTRARAHVRAAAMPLPFYYIILVWFMALAFVVLPLYVVYRVWFFRHDKGRVKYKDYVSSYSAGSDMKDRSFPINRTRHKNPF